MTQDLTREIVGFVSRQGWRYRLTDEYVELACPVGCGGNRNPFAIHKATGGGSCRKCGWRGGLDALKRMVGEKPEGNLLPAAPPPKRKTPPLSPDAWGRPHESLWGQVSRLFNVDQLKGGQRLAEGVEDCIALAQAVRLAVRFEANPRNAPRLASGERRCPSIELGGLITQSPQAGPWAAREPSVPRSPPRSDSVPLSRRTRSALEAPKRGRSRQNFLTPFLALTRWSVVSLGAS